MAKVKIIIDLSKDSQHDLEQLSMAFHGFVAAHGMKKQDLAEQSSESPVVEKVVPPAPAAEKVAPPTAVTEKVAPPKKEEKKKSDLPPATTAATSESPAQSGPIAIKDLRGMVGKLVGNHRDAIKLKLTEFGANNISSLAEKHYGDMFDFLINLDDE